ncbi:MAG: type I restriction enzyme HsdR N-terminal domain-containing protein [Chitinophagales bacterium]
MITVNYPEPAFRTEKREGKEFIFDPIRRQWVALADEEWVRQNFIQYMVQVHQYPAAMIAVEKEIMLGELKKRFDILVYDKMHRPWMLVECKASDIKLDDAVFQQLLRYHISVPASFLIITNGHYTYGWEKAGTALKEIQHMPMWR